MQSTDTLREVMRTMIPKDEKPILHESSFTAWKEVPAKDDSDEDMVRRVVDGYTEQAMFLSVAVQAVVDRALHERVSVIIEGVHVYPAMIASLKQTEEAVVVPLMLGIFKKNKLLARMKGRSTEVPRRSFNRYQKYFDQIWTLQSFLMLEADVMDVPIISNDDKNDVFREIMLITINQLAENFDKTPDEVFG
jgi:2-phosphoglycerate kinase